MSVCLKRPLWLFMFSIFSFIFLLLPIFILGWDVFFNLQTNLATNSTSSGSGSLIS